MGVARELREMRGDEHSITAERVRQITEQVLSRPSSLDAKLKGSDDELGTLSDLLMDSESIQEALTRSMLCRDLQAVMEHHLETDEQRLLVLRFGLADGVHRTVRHTG